MRSEQFSGLFHWHRVMVETSACVVRVAQIGLSRADDSDLLTIAQDPLLEPAPAREMTPDEIALLIQA